MKKILYIFSAILLLWGCEKNEDAYNFGQDDVLTEEVQGTELPEVLYASVVIEQDTVTRTYVGGANRDEVLWQNGDAISFFSGNIHNARYDYEGEGGTTSVELIKDETKPGTNGSLIHRSQAVYPYNENITVVHNAEQGVDKINLTYPTTQKYAPNSFGKDANIMVAAGESNEDDELYFRNACGYLVIKLYGAGTTVKSITLSSVSGLDKIVGNAVVVASNNAAPVITMADDASTSVTLDCSNGGAGVALGVDAEHATEFWFCLPPVTFTDGIKITVTDTNDEAYTKQTNKTVNITRNDVQPMAALKFNTNAPAATKLWYTRADNSTAPISFGAEFNALIKSHKWDGSKFVVEFKDPLTTITAYAFEDSKLGTITLPEGITTIEEGAFNGSTLLNINIPGSVNNIGIDVFGECSNLQTVTFLPSATKTPLQIGRKEGIYNYGPFYDTSLNSIDLNRELILVKGDGTEFAPNSWWHGMFATEKAEEGDIESVSVKLGPQVETISDYMFNYLPIESLTIPGTVKTIGNDVFNYCTKLASLTFEPSPTGEPLTIGYEADDGEDENLFQESCPLTTINLNRELIYTFEEEAETIDSDSEGLFGEIPTLANVTLGEQVKTLQKYMFAGSGITELVIPGTVNTIANDVFHNCKNLATLTFEASPTETALTIGYDTDDEAENLFQDNNKLTTLNLNRELIYTFGDSSIDTSSEGMFGGMPTLTSVTLGEQVKTLQKYMFAGSGITALEIPATVTSIAQNVFDDCQALRSITFAESANALQLKSQGDSYGPFYDSPLATIVFNRPIDYRKLNGDEFNPTSDALGLFAINPSLKSQITEGTNLTIGQNILTISNHMFCNLPIKALTIPGEVNTIGNDVFNGCDQLAILTFEASPTETALTIGYEAEDGEDENLFQEWCPLTTLNLNRELIYTFEENAETIDSYSEGLFGEIPTLTSVTLGEQVKTLQKWMFAGSGVTSLNLNKVETIQEYALAGVGITELVIPGTLNTIGNNVFNDCVSLAELTFEPSPTETPLTIGYETDGESENLFQQWCPLTTLNLNRELNYTFGDSYIDSNSEGLFGEMPTLVNVTLGEQVKTLQKYMFANTGITKLEILGNVTEIKDYAFYNCTALEELRFGYSATPLTLGFQDWSDELGPFYQSPLKYIKLDRDITYNANYAASCDQWDEGAFSNQYYESGDWIAKVIIGGNVTTLPSYMFATMRMQQLHIPESVEYIGTRLVEDCKVLNAIVLYDTEKRPETIEDSPFGEGSYRGTAPDDAPGKLQYYVFVPYMRGGGANGVYWVNAYDADNYWGILYKYIMVEYAEYFDLHIERNHESRYYDKEKGGEAGIIPGYEWYYQRYYLKQEVTPPTE